MLDGLIKSASDNPSDPRIYGVAVGYVIDNLDVTGLARVQVNLPWLPGVEPWARVATLMAGENRGMYCIPQVGDEVLLAFNHGDINEPFVLASVWNRKDSPPTDVAIDAVNKRLLRTPLGHEIEIDDSQQSITITSINKQTIKIDTSGIKIATANDTAKIQMQNSGQITIEANTSIELKAPSIRIQGDTLDIQGSASASINGGSMCEVKGAVVKIN